MRYSLLYILLFLCHLTEAQQFSVPDQVQRNYLYVNPAFAGRYNVTVVSLMDRTKWIGVDGALTYQNFELQAPLKKQSVALGLQARHEKIGASSNNEVFFDYCHRIKMGSSRLTFGIKAGIISKSLGEVTLQQTDAIDPAFSDRTSVMYPNFGVGMSVYGKNYFAGISIPYLLEAVSSSDGNLAINHDMDKYSFVFTAGGKFDIADELEIEPYGTYVYSMALKPQYTLITNLNFKSKFLVGFGYRSAEALIFNAGYYLNRQISLIYSYDLNIGLIGPYSKGSHEIGLLYYLGYKVNTVNARDF